MKSFKVFSLIFVFSSLLFASDITEVKKQNATEVINKFIFVLQNNSFEEGAGLILPLVHKSLIKRGVLDRDIYHFSYKKAYYNAKRYAYPVVITRVQKNKTTGIGYGDSYQKGVEYRFWIDKKNHQDGMPAPLVVFFEENSNDAKLSYIGSL